MIFWNRTLADMVRRGFGAKIKMSVIVASYVQLAGCDMVVPDNFQQTWEAWGMGPFWSYMLPSDEFDRRWAAATQCKFYKLNTSTRYARCTGSGNAFERATLRRSNPFPCQGTSDFTLFLEQLLQILGPVLLRYGPPFPYTYAGLHVRHGEKVVEFPVFSLEKHMADLRMTWPSVKRVFVASDDAKVIAAAKEGLWLTHGGYATVKWTVDEKRWTGGVPYSQYLNHTHDRAAIRAVLGDFSALALSTVLVGSAYSNFFDCARLLNLALHSDIRWHEPWCYDIANQSVCDKRFSVWQGFGPALASSHND